MELKIFLRANHFYSFTKKKLLIIILLNACRYNFFVVITSNKTLAEKYVSLTYNST